MKLHRATRLVPLVAAMSLSVALSGCGGDAGESGETVIEGPLAEEIGLGDLDATCEQPDELAEGETFDCTATTSDGEIIEFEALLTSDDEFDIVATNLLTTDEVDVLRSDAATQLGAQIGVEIAAESIACPDGTVVLDDDELVCEITDVDTGDVYELTMTFAEFDRDTGFGDIQYLIGDQPIR